MKEYEVTTEEAVWLNTAQGGNLHKKGDRVQFASDDAAKYLVLQGLVSPVGDTQAAAEPVAARASQQVIFQPPPKIEDGPAPKELDMDPTPAPTAKDVGNADKMVVEKPRVTTPNAKK